MLQSRVADSLYWIARYLERAGHTIRLIDVRLDLELDRRDDADGWDFARLCAVVNCGAAAGAPANPAELVDTLVFDASNRGSVLACVTAARDNARQAREEISSDMWEQLNALYLRLKQVRGEGTGSIRPHYLSRLIIEGVHLFEGVTDATMGHGSSSARRRPPRWSICSSGARRSCPRTTWSGPACSARAPRSRPTSAATPPMSDRIASPSSCC